MLEKDASLAAEAESLTTHTKVSSDSRARVLLVIEADQRQLESIQAFLAQQGVDIDMPPCPIDDLLQGVERYHMITENMSETVWLSDMNMKATYISPSIERLRGYTLAEIQALPLERSVTPRSLPTVLKFLAEDMAPAKMAQKDLVISRTEELEYYKKDGTTFWSDVTVSVVRNAQGEPVGLLGVGRDITARKQAEEALRCSEERYRNILESIEEGYYELDLSGNITFCNDVLPRILGYTPEEVIGLNYRVYTDDETQRRLFDSYHEVYQTGIPKKGVEWELARMDGSRVIIESSISLMRDEKAVPVGFRSIARDISERRRAEEALVANRAKSEFLANMSHEIRTPMNGIIGMTGLLLDTELSIEQRGYAETVRNSAEGLLAIINDILDFSKIEAGKLELENLEFDLRTTLEDVVELLAMRAQEKGLELTCLIEPEVPCLLEGDPGRLRQILTNLIGNAVKFTHAGEVRLHVGLEHEDASHASIRFAVEDTGIGIPNEKIGSLFQPFNQVEASTTRRFGGTGLGLSICRRLTDIMGGQIGVKSNLGMGTIFWFTLGFAKQDRTDPEIENYADINNLRVLIVEGHGASRKVLSAMLKGWGCRWDETVDASSALEKLQGAASQGDPFRLVLVDAHLPDMEGELFARKIKADEDLKATILVMLSSIGKRGDAARFERAGFSAYLTKPVKQAALYYALAAAVGRRSGPEHGQGRIITRHRIVEDRKRRLRILLVEDNPINQTVALKFLEKLGYRADAVANGIEAIQALKTIPYDLVLMDVQMPEMDGIEATRIIRDPQSPVLDHGVRIIALTAHAMKGDRERCLEAGMDDYLSKPVQFEGLMHAIERFTQASSCSAPPPAKVSDGIFDRVAVLNRLGGDSVFLKELLCLCLREMPRQIATLEDALLRMDLVRLKREAHSIKGAAENVGASGLKAAAMDMEIAAGQGDLEGAAGRLDRIKSAFALFRQCLEEHGGG